MTLNASVNAVDTFTTTTGNDTEPDNGTYYYMVTAENSSAVSPISNCVSGVVAIPPQVFMNAPLQMWNWSKSEEPFVPTGVAVDRDGNSFVTANIVDPF
jgi:hypothetical protein